MSASTHADRTHKRQRTLRHEPLEERCLLAGDAAAAINQFAFDLYQHMQHEEGNLFFSPLSISTALAMTYAGAGGQTAAEMEEVLHFGDSEDIHAAFGELLASFAERTGEDPAPPVVWPFPGDPPDWWHGGSPASFDFQMDVANGIWSGQSLMGDYSDVVTEHYDAQIQGADFSDAAQVKDGINEWVSDVTRGRIQDLVDDLSSATVAVIVNAVFFNGSWDDPFDPEFTQLGSFTTPKDVVNAEIMYGQPDVYRTTIDGFDVIEMTMSDGEASAIFMMPLVEDGSNMMTEELFVGITDWTNSAGRSRRMTLINLPKFSTDIATDFNHALAGLGMPTAFIPGSADFSPMFGANGQAEEVYIRKVFHKATLEVNEQGTTAAAATEVELALCFAAGTSVLTPDGAAPIEEVRVGDTVLARNEHLLEGPVEPRVVEATRHGEAEILELHLGRRVIRTTELHPFFVEGQGWLPAAEISSGDRLACDRGGAIAVSYVQRTGKVEAVFNLRVAEHRTFFIGEDDWGFGVWTHNFYDTGFYANRPFHLMIRDNVTDTIAFMGRIDDPTQLENSVTPQVIESNADWGDFDNSGVVDQADYALWRSSYGQTGSRLQADGNGDGRVDSADYTVWRDNLGATAAAPLVVEAVADADEAVVDDQPAPAAPLVLTPSPRPQRSLGGPVRPQRALSSTEAEPDLLLLLAAQRQRAAQAEQLNAHVETGETAEEEPVREVFATVDSWLDSPL
ncbi:Serpin (serine protease inhibitor) [Posidoniimonas corsicana]|uniref:Serpin (Serine protease inhibitor) n=1 Tax=Posidoniimonas corsicana TaxID=1938618 RepID=A0A5C5V4S8_9BACT|nr:serpin family protein [Posidoniimonas corsicana]TWT33546.1 Serpin (serine protease inhibitor) [Posidoniimonas corsicana]